MWLRCFSPRTNPVAARDKNTDNGTILRWCWATNQGQQKHSSKTVAPRGWSQGKKRFKFTTFEPTLRGANINSFDTWLRWPGPRTNKRRDQIGTKTRLRGLSFDDAEQQTKDCGSPAQGPVAAKGWHQTGKKRFKLDIIWTYLGRVLVSLEILTKKHLFLFLVWNLPRLDCCKLLRHLRLVFLSCVVLSPNLQNIAILHLLPEQNILQTQTDRTKCLI